MISSKPTLVLFAVLGFAGALFPQAGTGTLTGKITDATGAVLPGAAVTVRDPANGFTRTTVTSDAGDYSMPGLRPSTYDVTAELTGFRKHSQTGFRIEIDQTARLDLRLQVGAPTEIVEVHGAAQLLHTENATLGAVIDRKKIVDLPLNGRNFVQLALLVPGVNTGQPGAGRGGGVSIGGTRSEQNAFQLDGVSNTEQYDTGISFRPSVDAIEEFKIEVNNYSAEFGKGAGGQINVATRSGTNGYHGTLYEFNRNDAVQARNLFDRNPNFVSSDGRFLAPPLNRNEFGGSLGGRIVRDRTFFFTDYQALRQVSGGVGRRSVPTAALKAGNLSSVLGGRIGTDSLGRDVFANQVYDPTTSRLVGTRYLRDPFPGNVIPQSRFDPVALKIVQRALWPEPNAVGTLDPRTGNPRDNYFDNRPGRSSGDQFFLRVDHRLSSADTLYGRWGINDTDSFGSGNFPGNERLTLNRQQVVGAVYTRTMGPTKVNDLRFGYQRERPKNGAQRIIDGQNLVKELGIKGLPLAGPGAPTIDISGFTGFGDGDESRREDDSFQIIDQFSFSKSRHFFKVGFEFRRMKLDVFNIPATTRGTFDFGNQEWTSLEGFPGSGNTFANFLLGLPRQKARRPGDHATLLRASEYAGYFQDDWKVTGRLTFNYGVRYQLYIPPKETRDHIAAIALPFFPSNYAEGATAFCKDPRKCASLSTSLDPLNLGLTLADLVVAKLPRVVVAGREVPRSLTDVEKNDFGPRIGIAYRLSDRTVVRTGYGMFFDTVPASYFQDSVENLPFVREDQQSLSSFQFGPPTAESFLGYVLDDPPIGSFTPGPNTFEPGFRNAYVQHWNLSVQRQIGNSFVAEISYAGNKSTRLNRRENLNTREPRSSSAMIPSSVHPQLRRLFPYAVFDDQLITLDNWFTTSSSACGNYHALMGRLERRFSGGLTFLNAFTWGKAISDSQPFAGGDNDTGNRIQDIFNRRADKALASFDHKYRFTSSFVYDLPFGRARHFGAAMSPVLNQIIGGWQLSGIVSVQSGFPITVRRNGDPLGVGTNGAVRPHQVCAPNLGTGEHTLDRFFRQECFTAPSDSFGNAGRSTVTGPASEVADLALFKNFFFTSVREDMRLQIRSEFFNAFNHPNWNMPGRDLGGSNFGAVTSAASPRIIQFGVKLIF